MLFVFMWFIQTTNCECAYTIETKLGIEDVNIETRPGDNICVNITQYPFFVMILDYDNGDSFYKYTRNRVTHELVEDYHALLRYLPLYHSFPNPSSSFTIQTPEESQISMILISFPGMCRNGIYFSNYQIDYANFSINLPEESFFSLKPYDDKCLMFGAIGDHHIEISINNFNVENQFFIYSSYTNFTALNESQTFLKYDSKESRLLRFIVDENDPIHDVNILFKASENLIRNDVFDFYLPPIALDDCEAGYHWVDENIAIVFVSIAAGLGFIILLCIAFFCVFTDFPSVPTAIELNDTSHVSPKDKETQSLLPENNMPY